MSVKLNSCMICRQNSELYICVSPLCLKSENNQLTCFKCFHKNHNSQQHQPESLTEIQQISQQNQKDYAKFIEQYMKDITIEQQKYEKYIEDSMQKIRKWFDDQKKIIRAHYDKEYQILQDNINQAQSKELNLNKQLQFFFYKSNNQVELFERRNHQFERYKNFEMMELDFKIQYLTETKQTLPSIEIKDYLNLTLNNDNQVEILYCQTHKKQKKYLCTNQNCLNINANCFCDMCIIEKKICHNDKDLIKLDEISSKLEEKKQQISQQKFKIEQQMISEIDSYVEKNWKYKKSQMEQMVQTKAILIAEGDAFKNLQKIQENYLKIKPVNPILYTKSSEQINSEFQNIYEIFKKKLQVDQKKIPSIPNPLELFQSNQLSAQREIQPNKIEKEVQNQKNREKSQTFYFQTEAQTPSKTNKRDFELILQKQENNPKNEIQNNNDKPRKSIQITEIPYQNENNFQKGPQKNIDQLHSTKSETDINKAFDFEKKIQKYSMYQYDQMTKCRTSLAQDNINKLLEDKYQTKIQSNPYKFNIDQNNNQKQLNQKSFSKKENVNLSISRISQKG